jgi:hypothetical protein
MPQVCCYKFSCMFQRARRQQVRGVGRFSWACFTLPASASLDAMAVPCLMHRCAIQEVCTFCRDSALRISDLKKLGCQSVCLFVVHVAEARGVLVQGQTAHRSGTDSTPWHELSCEGIKLGSFETQHNWACGTAGMCLHIVVQHTWPLCQGPLVGRLVFLRNQLQAS